MHHLNDAEPSSSTYKFFDTNPEMSDQMTQTIRYECNKCDSLFTSRIYLHHHEANIHNHIFHCPFCSALFSNKPDFKTHVTAHSEKRFLPCAFCKKSFHELTSYEEHIKMHQNPFLYSCDKCPAMFPQLSSLRVHTSLHLKKKFVHTIPKGKKLITRSYRKLLKKLSKSQVIDSDVLNINNKQANILPTAEAESIIHQSIASMDNDEMISTVINQLLNKTNRKKNLQKPLQKIIKISASIGNLSSCNNGVLTDANDRRKTLRPRHYKIGKKLESPSGPVTNHYNLRVRHHTAVYNFGRITSSKSRNFKKRNIISKFFSCLFCKRVFTNGYTLNKHKIIHAKNMGITCNKCGGLFGGNGALAWHKKSKHFS